MIQDHFGRSVHGRKVVTGCLCCDPTNPTTPNFKSWSGLFGRGAAIDILNDQAHLVGLGGPEVFVFDASQSFLFFVGEVFGVLAPDPKSVFERGLGAGRPIAKFVFAHLIDRSVDMRDDVIFVEDDLGIAAPFRDSRAIGFACPCSRRLFGADALRAFPTLE